MNRTSLINLLFAYFTLTILFASSVAPKEVAAAQPQRGITSAGQLIAAVNNLRIANGLAPLSEHPALMQSAQSQADYMAAIGAVTHTRPSGTYTQQLLALGFPLAGDLSMGGLRSENILSVYGGLNWDSGVPDAWQDAQHMNTMLSGNFTHIGAGVSQSGENYYYAVDTAAATGSGLPQESAAEMLTRVPEGERVADASQFMVPVALSTPLPDGKIFHKVQYGQSLWSIAIAYGTTIKNIQQLNNLGEESTVYQGQELLVLIYAPQTAAPTIILPTMVLPTMTLAPTATRLPTLAPKTADAVAPTASAPLTPQRPISSRLLTVVLIIAALVGAGMAVWLIRDPEN